MLIKVVEFMDGKVEDLNVLNKIKKETVFRKLSKPAMINI
ncbi:hypothetical protein KR50_21130 [Jeotgalibacillus campisalis]|uniref:Uncharacterized protein n=1 Tax=Jeotgalibacillus campisalis TaxID=220754 RepID=A0A0C2VU46_9BACL|nr:hypothetical protein KR50_21130 [Jeotgalibacillus campisalis]